MGLLVLPHCLPFLKSPGQCQRKRVGNCPSIVRVFLRRQSKMTITCSPSCPLPLFPSTRIVYPVSFSGLKTKSRKLNESIMMRWHPRGVSPHTEAILARKKRLTDLTALCAGVVNFQEISWFQSVRESSSGVNDRRSVQRSHQICQLANLESRGNLSNPRISKQ